MDSCKADGVREVMSDQQENISSFVSSSGVDEQIELEMKPVGRIDWKVTGIKNNTSTDSPRVQVL